MFGIFTHPRYTQQLQTFIDQHFTTILPCHGVFFTFTGSIAPSYFSYNLDRMAATYIPYRQACDWHIGASGIIYGLAFFLFFSGTVTKICPT